MFVNGVAGLIDIGLIREIEGQPDEDWKKTAMKHTTTNEKANTIKAMLNVKDMKNTVTVAIATKTNYWVRNHHTGQGAVARYVKKVLDIFYQDRVNEQVVTATHSLGHFTSTLYMLACAGIEGIRLTTRTTSQEGASIKMSDDAKFRFKYIPARTHRLAVSYEVAKKMVRGIYAKFCPNIGEFADLPRDRARVMQNPAGYHIGASYLTGKPRIEYADTDIELLMGRLGTFIQVLFKNSTLAKSPHFQLARVESYEDYDAKFKQTLLRILTIQATTRGRVVEQHVEEIGVISDEDVQALRDRFKA